MHDPDVVAFTIPRPWPSRSSFSATGNRQDGVRWRMRLFHDCGPWCADEPPHPSGAFPWWKLGSYSHFWRIAGRDFYWPPLVTVWHREPGGRDALEVCRPGIKQPDGTWKFSRTWRWHVRHWRFQVHPYQQARRWLLTRCTWCGGRSRKGDPVNCGNSWHPAKVRWWRGELELFHQECLDVHRAHGVCLCESPGRLGHGNYGTCSACGRFRPYGYTPNDPDRWLAALGHRQRPGAALRARLDKAYEERRASEGAGAVDGDA